MALKATPTENGARSQISVVKENSVWVLSSDERLDSNEVATSEPVPTSQSPELILPPPLPAPSDPPSQPMSLIEDTKPQSVASEPFHTPRLSSFGKSIGSISSLSNQSHDISSERETLLAQAVNVNKQLIVNYAHLYAGTFDSHCNCQRSYNSSYRDFSGQGAGGDCTNFISQALKYAGWKEVFNSPFDALSQASRANSSLWWYNSVAQSYTWVGAPYLFDSLKSSNGAPRATREFDLSKLEPGDIIQVDFAGDPYGITHTVVVTHKIPISTPGVTGRNLLRIAYHSTNTLDRSFDDFYGSNPGAVYYAWKIRSSY